MKEPYYVYSKCITLHTQHLSLYRQPIEIRCYKWLFQRGLVFHCNFAIATGMEECGTSAIVCLLVEQYVCVFIHSTNSIRSTPFFGVLIIFFPSSLRRRLLMDAFAHIEFFVLINFSNFN